MVDSVTMNKVVYFFDHQPLHPIKWKKKLLKGLCLLKGLHEIMPRYLANSFIISLRSVGLGVKP